MTPKNANRPIPIEIRMGLAARLTWRYVWRAWVLIALASLLVTGLFGLAAVLLHVFAFSPLGMLGIVATTLTLYFVGLARIIRSPAWLKPCRIRGQMVHPFVTVRGWPVQSPQRMPWSSVWGLLWGIGWRGWVVTVPFFAVLRTMHLQQMHPGLFDIAALSMMLPSGFISLLLLLTKTYGHTRIDIARAGDSPHGQ